MKVPSLLLLLPIFIVALGALHGCRFKQSDSIERQTKKYYDFSERSDQLYAIYLTGNANEARQSLEKDIDSIIEGKEYLEPGGRAGMLFLAYCRLYVLEKRLGNNVEAEANLIKARYWLIRKGELLGLPTGETMQEVLKFTPAKIVETIDAFDKKLNDGSSPNYFQSIEE